MNKTKITLLSALTICFLAIGCNKDNGDDMYPNDPGTGCDSVNVTFSAQVKPVIDSKCATSGCHAAAAPTGINLSNHSGVAAIANSGKLMSAITHDGNASAMPQGSAKLDDCTIAKVRKWVNDGAPNN